MLSHPDLRETARHRVFREFIANVFNDKRDVILGRS